MRLAVTLGIKPISGRDFESRDDRSGGPQVLLLGYKIWQARFGERERARVKLLRDLVDKTYGGRAGTLTVGLLMLSGQGHNSPFCCSNRWG